MAYKRTGRPPGRPKTKEYKTVLARIPAELAELVERYRAERGQISVSELIREGLEWRSVTVIRVVWGCTCHSLQVLARKCIAVIQKQRQGHRGRKRCRRMRALLARQGEQIQALAQAVERQTVAAQSNVYSSNTGSVLAVEVNGGEVGPVEYDRTKFKLGKLCKGGHEFGHTGQSLLTIKGSHCPPCRAAQERERQRVKREVQEAGVTS